MNIVEEERVKLLFFCFLQIITSAIINTSPNMTMPVFVVEESGDEFSYVVFE